MVSLLAKEYFCHFRYIGRFKHFVRSQQHSRERDSNSILSDPNDDRPMSNRDPHRYDEVLESEDEDQFKQSLEHPYQFRDLSEYKDFSQFIPPQMRSRGNLRKLLEPRPFKFWMKSKMKNHIIKTQSHDPENVEMIGADLACAYIFVSNGGGVKFLGEDNFLRLKSRFDSYSLPTEKNEKYKVEAIDASGMKLVFEALENLKGLKFLRWVNFSKCTDFDNWFLDYLSVIAPNIEYLDISHCTKVDHDGLGCIYRFRKLRCLNIEGVNNDDIFKLACLSLESENPNLVILGIPLTAKPTPKSVFDEDYS